MKRNARWLVTLFVVSGILVGSVIPGLAADPDGVENIRRLALENRVAEVIADLGLTQGQKDQLKQVAETYRSTRAAMLEELADLLAERRDALLAGDREALDNANKALRDLTGRDALMANEQVAEFVAGLTERQRQRLTQILPGIGRQVVRQQVRAWSGPGPGPGPGAAAPVNVMLYMMPGAEPEVVDVLIDLLDR